jgi:hypothetical protein
MDATKGEAILFNWNKNERKDDQFRAGK